MNAMLGWTRLTPDGATWPCGCRLELRRDGTERWVRIRYCPTHTATTDAVSKQALPRTRPCPAAR